MSDKTLQYKKTLSHSREREGEREGGERKRMRMICTGPVYVCMCVMSAFSPDLLE